MAEKIKIICKMCGKEYWCFACYIKRDGKRLYCSNECWNKAKKGSGNPRYNKDEGWVVCRGCGKKFKIKPSSVKYGKGKTYCSKECNKSHTGKISSKCLECGKEYYHYQTRTSKFCSRNCSSSYHYKRNGQMNKGVQRGKGGKRIDLNNQYFRSSWEANYARFLNFLVKKKEILKWEYEVDTFEFHSIKKGTRFYTPDFKVYGFDGNVVYHEVKGWMDKKSITRHKRMKKFYPLVQVLIIDKKWFRLNGKILSGVIDNWEYSY